MSKIEIFASERTVDLVIECPSHTCTLNGCTADHHRFPGWRVSKRLSSSMDHLEALKELETHAEKFPASGPYRLVRYVETTEQTREVLA